MTLSYSDTFPTNNVKVSFEEFEPNKSNQRKLRDYLIEVEESSPSDASITAHFSKEGHRYKGSLQVLSQKKDFLEENFSEDLSQLIDELFIKIKDEIQKWKKNRFKNISDEVS
ncbi:MAG: hypothetical protein CME68_02825 [Halobacteriovoraceae bacterium]|nr:hypothetical protein [Halobacteriovoraceae bacterium]